MPKLKVSLGQYDTGWHNVAESLTRADAVVAQAAAQGAQLVVLPEMCTTGFTMETETYAESLDGPSCTGFAELARKYDVYIIAGAPTSCESCYHNSAFVFEPHGKMIAEYRKQRLFNYANETEHYTPGDKPVIVTIEGVRIGLFICFDLRFPELFREVARDVDAVVVIANWPATRRKHWDILIQSRAIENQFYVVAVNRLGEGGKLKYDGGSAIIGPRGEDVVRLDESANEPTDSKLTIGTLDTDYVAQVREEFPVLT